MFSSVMLRSLYQELIAMASLMSARLKAVTLGMMSAVAAISSTAQSSSASAPIVYSRGVKTLSRTVKPSPTTRQLTAINKMISTQGR